jgi:signal transduction histidine kinase
VNTEDARSPVQVLARALLDDVERIAQRSVARMQEVLPSYARIPHDELAPITLANTRNLLQAICDPEPDRGREQQDYRASGVGRARQGITSDEMLHAWRIGLEGVREAANAVAEQRGIGKKDLLQFVEATLQWGDVGMRASASAHNEAEFRELTRLGREQAALRRVATMVARDDRPDEVFAKVAEEVGVLLAADVAGVWHYEPGGHATLVATWGDLGPALTVGSRWKLDGHSVSTLVYRTERSARIDAYAQATGSIGTELRKREVRSTVGSPIFVSGRLWGMVGAASKTDPMPADAELRIVEFTELVATAIANLQARGEVERLANEQAALRRVATLVARERPTEEVFAHVAEEVGRLLGVQAALLHRYEPDGDAIVLGSWPDAVKHAFPVGRRQKLDGDRVTSLVFRTRRPVRLDSDENVPGSMAADARGLGLRTAVGTPIFVGDDLWGLILAATSRPEPLPADAESRIAQFTELVATAMSNERARSELQRLAEEQAALRRVATVVARAAPPEEVFVKVAEEVGPLLGAEAGSIDRFEPDGYCTVVGSWGKLDEAFEVGSRWKLEGASVSASVYRTGRPVRLDSYEDEPGPIAAEVRKVGLGSAVGSPIVVDGRVWGALLVAASRPESLPVDTESRIAQFAELVAAAIANVQARSDLAESRARIIAAADDERRRMVRDLHDGAQQRLVHTIVTLKLAHRELERSGQQAEVLLSEAQQHAQSATEELGELAHGILPSVLTIGGLGAGVTALASRMSIPVVVDVSVDRLPRAAEATAYFIVAEALTNVAKHSQARQASVTVRAVDGMVEVGVRDDGLGGAGTDGPGLVGLSDRLAAVGGRLRVASPRGGGTLIVASIPTG